MPGRGVQLATHGGVARIRVTLTPRLSDNLGCVPGLVVSSVGARVPTVTWVPDLAQPPSTVGSPDPARVNGNVPHGLSG